MTDLSLVLLVFARPAKTLLPTSTERTKDDSIRQVRYGCCKKKHELYLSPDLRGVPGKHFRLFTAAIAERRNR